MIIGLYGSDSVLMTKIKKNLSDQGFQFCEFNKLDSHEENRHYFFRKLKAPTNRENVFRQNIILVWIGESVESTVPFDLVLSPQDSEKDSQIRINHLIKDQLSSLVRPSWDEYFMRIAQVASMRSNCIKRKVGALIIRDRRIISTGYNGTPRGTKNCNEGGCPRCNSLTASGTRLEDCLCSHAEENSITQAAFHGTTDKDGVLYTTFSPCLMCAKMAINSGIVEVIFNIEYPLNEISFQLFEQAGVRIRKFKLI